MDFKLYERLEKISSEFPTNLEIYSASQSLLENLSLYPEYYLIDGFIRTFSNHTYEPSIREHVDSVVQTFTENRNRFALLNTIYRIKNGDDPLAKSVVSELDQLATCNEDEIKRAAYGFHIYESVSPSIKRFREMVLKSDDFKEPSTLRYNDVYSLVERIDESNLLISVNNQYYQYNINESTIKVMSTPSHQFIRRSQFLEQENCVVDSNGLTYYHGDNKIHIAKNGKLTINKKPVVEGFEASMIQAFGYANHQLAHQLIDIKENIDNIVQLDFCKKVVPTYKSPLDTYLFVTESNMYLDITDNVAKDRKFIGIEKDEMLSFIKENYGEDISKSLSIFENYNSEKRIAKDNHNNIVRQKIQFLNEQIDELKPLGNDALPLIENLQGIVGKLQKTFK